MTEKLSIILLNFHGLADTIECLDSLRAADLGAARVLLLDNGSGVTEAEALMAWNETTGFFGETVKINKQAALGAGTRVHTLLLSEVNHGFAGGNNLATRLALAAGDEEVLLLNNDTTVTPGFLTALLAARARHPNAALIPQIRLHARPYRMWNCGGELRFPGRKVYHYENAPVASLPADGDFPVSFVTGCALLYRPALTGLLTERFFFGEEDMEFSLRLRRLGLPALCVTGSVIYHKVGTTLKSTHRKSEIFTLKRLINLRHNVGRGELAAAYGYYLINLLRLDLFRYRRSPRAALRTLRRVWRDARRLDGVGETLSVGYVRGGEYDAGEASSPKVNAKLPRA